MPSRLVIAGIVLFWLGATTWFVVRDLLPRWQTGDAPPFTINLSDEAVRQIVPIRWKILRGDKPIGTLRTQLRFLDADDAYALTSDSANLNLLDTTLPFVGEIGITAEDYSDTWRIGRDGELRGLHTKVTLAIRTGKQPALRLEAELAAELRGGRLQRRLRLAAQEFGEYAPPLESGEPIHGRILSPLHPVNRIEGLAPGQRWRQSIVSPHEDIVRAALSKLPGAERAAQALGDAQPRWLQASVRAAPEILSWDHSDVECLVVDYRNWQSDDVIAHTWVRRSDGIVLRQEADFQGQKLVLERE